MMIKYFHNERIIKIWSIILIWIFWGIIFTTVEIYFSNSKTLSRTSLVYSILSFNGIWISLILYSFYNRVIQKPLNSLLLILMIIVSCFLLSTLLAFINTSISRYIFELEPIYYHWTAYLILAYTKIFVLLGLSGIYFLIRYWSNFHEQKEKTLEATALANKAQLQMLQYQLNPHFLFNALNSLRTLIHEDTQKADQIVTDLSEFLRYTLSTPREDMVSFSNELEIIHYYLDIQKIRFEENLEIVEDCQPETLDFKIPAFLLHPIIENAIKYGIQTSKMPLKIELTAKQENGLWQCRISNSGCLIKTEHNMQNNSNGTGTGIKNVKKRIEHYYPDENHFDIIESNGWVHVSIALSNKTQSHE